MIKETKKNTTISSKKNIKKQRSKKIKNKTKLKEIDNYNIGHKSNKKLTMVIILLFGTLLIFSTYAWFSTNLNVKIKTFNMVVSRSSDLTLSLDGVNFDRSIEISKDVVYENLGKLYPNYNTQWPSNGLIPVSSIGITNPNSYQFDIYQSAGVLYNKYSKNKKGFLYTIKAAENEPREYNYYLAFDVFIKNQTGSPVPDNLYLDPSTSISIVDEVSEEMQGLINSFRIGLVKVGSVGINSSVNEIQNISCNNNCRSLIYEPNRIKHSQLSIERAKKYGINLVDGEEFPTYAYKKEGGPIYVENSISGSQNLDLEYFLLQETFSEDNLNQPLFTIPDGITKVRIYLWIEGQDIDSLETYSEGTEIEINLDFSKDVAGYNAFN